MFNLNFLLPKVYLSYLRWIYVSTMFCPLFARGKLYSETRMRYNVSSPVWGGGGESSYMRIFSPANRASLVAKSEIRSKWAGTASRAKSCNRNVENTYDL